MAHANEVTDECPECALLDGHTTDCTAFRPRELLPSFTSIGCYPIIYVTTNGEVLCAECATAEPKTPEGDVHWEGDSLFCDECNAEIESAYGPVEED